jgi:hypothetical protein
MKYTLTSVIPVMQYGNIQPSIEVEAETFEEAQAIAEPKMAALWNKYNPGVLSDTSSRKKLQAFVGGEIYYDEVAHVYTNEAGEVYESGSQYAKKFEKPFDGAAIASKMATKYGVEAKDISEMWELKARTSREFGTALHSALELYGRYDGLAKALERETHLHDHPVIKKAVQGFYDGRENEKAEYEVLVVDHDRKQAGRIDRLLIDKSNPYTCRVQDFKTNALITDDKLKVYWKQLGFYGGILVANGWTVLGLDIFTWDGTWKEINRVTS